MVCYCDHNMKRIWQLFLDLNSFYGWGTTACMPGMGHKFSGIFGEIYEYFLFSKSAAVVEADNCKSQGLEVYHP